MDSDRETESTHVVHFTTLSRCNEPFVRVVRSKPPPMWSWIKDAVLVTQIGHMVSLWLNGLLGRQALRVNLRPQHEHRDLRA